MIAIADCGSSKIDWCIINRETTTSDYLHRFKTTGMNALLLSEDEICNRLDTEVKPVLDKLELRINKIYFYGAGCVSPNVCDKVKESLKKSLGISYVEVATDLLAAARALCGHTPGVACILGTGSNSCYYDGEKIAMNVSPLGYILGDEGSGAVLGKMFVGNVLKNQFPQDICTGFLEEYHLDALTIIDRVYRQPMPNRFLASFVPFIKKHLNREEVRNMVLASFKDFFIRNLQTYRHHHPQLSVANFIGSVACNFSDELRVSAQQCGWSIGKTLQSPMDGLITYHLDEAEN